MSNQIVISSGAKLRGLNGVITGTTGVLDSVPLGGANGVATLDSSGKVPVSQLPSSVVTYLGTWNAATNTPTLANGTGDAGDMYICNVAGTVDFGAGPITFAVGDWVLYGSGTWQKSNGQNGTVTSVAVTESGDALTITGSPITTAGTINIGFAGTSAQYVAGNGSLITFPSLTGYVPYTGATADVDLGTFKLNAQSLHVKGTAGAGHLGLKHQSATATASANESSLFANVNGDLGWKNDNLYLTTLATHANTADRVYTFPNTSGTVVLSNIDNNFTAEQTFQAPVDINNALNLKFNVSGVGLGGGQLGLYATKASTTSNLTLYDGDTSFYARFAFNNTSNKTYTLPSTSGTLALTSDIPSLSGTAPISYSGGVISISQATTSTNGYLSSTDWNNFQTAYANRIQSASSPLAFSMGILTIQQATTATNGYLSSTDWNTFNNKVSSQWTTSGSNIYYTSGNVGIGTISPVSLSNQTSLTINGTAVGRLDLSAGGSSNTAGMYATSSGGIVFSFGDLPFLTGASTTEKMRITGAGLIGIGTTTPWTNFAIGTTIGIGLSNDASGDLVGKLGFQFQNAIGGYAAAGVYNLQTGAYGGNLLFGTKSDGGFAIYERMRITSYGHLCVGLTEPLGNAGITVAPVNGQSFAQISIKANNASGSNPNLYLECPGIVGGGIYVDRNTSTLRVYQASSSNGVQLTNNATSWGSFSDERLKTDLVEIENAVSKVKSLRAVTGRYKTDKNDISRSFLIAQDVQKVLPEAVDVMTDDIGTLALRYTDTIPLLIAAIQEQQSQIEELKAKIK